VRFPRPERASGFPGRDVLDRPSKDWLLVTIAHDPAPDSLNVVNGRRCIRAAASTTCCPGAPVGSTDLLAGRRSRKTPRAPYSGRSSVASPLRASSPLPWSCVAQRAAFRSTCVLRSDDTDARKEALRCFGRSDRRATILGRQCRFGRRFRPRARSRAEGNSCRSGSRGPARNSYSPARRAADSEKAKF
jgi:hypothetical protein